MCRPSSAAAIVSFITRKKLNDSLNRAPMYYKLDWKSKLVRLDQNAKYFYSCFSRISYYDTFLSPRNETSQIYFVWCISWYNIFWYIFHHMNWQNILHLFPNFLTGLIYKFYIFISGGFSPNHVYVEAGEHEYRLTQYLMSSYEVNIIFSKT